MQTAHEQALAVGQKLRAGVDPVMEKRAQVPTAWFEQAADGRISEQRATWRNVKHAAQRRSTSTILPYPTLASASLAEITFPIARDAVLPIWLEKAETAGRVLQRIGAVLDWATAKRT